MACARAPRGTIHAAHADSRRPSTRGRKIGVSFRAALIATGLLALANGCIAMDSDGMSAPAGKSFSSAEVAAQSLVDALRVNDMTQLHAILGPAGDDILFSGDAVADRADAERFLPFYDESHYVRSEVGGVNMLIVGHDSWPFPVPIVQTDHGFVFDTDPGREEILNRRIGRNELASEQVCLAIVDAQREYVEQRPMGGDLPEYAKKLVSDPGKKNGLYWPTAAGEPPSPMGALVASASAQGYASGQPAAAGASSAAPLQPRPYHGYRYRLLTSQSANAQGGAINFLITTSSSAASPSSPTRPTMATRAS